MATMLCSQGCCLILKAAIRAFIRGLPKPGLTCQTGNEPEKPLQHAGRQLACWGWLRPQQVHHGHNVVQP